MSHTYAEKKREEPAHTVKEETAEQPSMAALRSGAADPTPNQMGRRVDLPEAMRAKMENAFGADLSAVRLYESQAVADAEARAITRGSDIAFAPGMLDFTSFGGQALLGHEISHVVSQARGEVTGGGFLSDHALEARADREGAMAAAGQQIAAPTAAMSAVTAANAAGPMQAAGKDKSKQNKGAANAATDVSDAVPPLPDPSLAMTQMPFGGMPDPSLAMTQMPFAPMMGMGFPMDMGFQMSMDFPMDMGAPQPPAPAGQPAAKKAAKKPRSDAIDPPPGGFVRDPDDGLYPVLDETGRQKRDPKTGAAYYSPSKPDEWEARKSKSAELAKKLSRQGVPLSSWLDTSLDDTDVPEEEPPAPVAKEEPPAPVAKEEPPAPVAKE